MPKTTCNSCGGPYKWTWDEAFEKFSFGDGDGQVETATVAQVLENAGYVVHHDHWGMHNDVIDSIKKAGVELIPAWPRVGYDNPRIYLPRKIARLLDRLLPAELEAMS